jgi:hypothetical protein
LSGIGGRARQIVDNLMGQELKITLRRTAILSEKGVVGEWWLLRGQIGQGKALTDRGIQDTLSGIITNPRSVMIPVSVSLIYWMPRSVRALTGICGKPTSQNVVAPISI